MSNEFMTIREGNDIYADVKIIDINDDLSGHTTIDFRQSLDKLARQGTNKIVLNLSAVRRVNSTFIGALAGTAKTIRQSGGDLKVYGLSDSVKRIFNLVGGSKFTEFSSAGASKFIEIYESEKQALSAFDVS